MPTLRSRLGLPPTLSPLPHGSDASSAVVNRLRSELRAKTTAAEELNVEISTLQKLLAAKDAAIETAERDRAAAEDRALEAGASAESLRRASIKWQKERAALLAERDAANAEMDRLTEQLAAMGDARGEATLEEVVRLRNQIANSKKEILRLKRDNEAACSQVRSKDKALEELQLELAGLKDIAEARSDDKNTIIDLQRRLGETVSALNAVQLKRMTETKEAQTRAAMHAKELDELQRLVEAARNEAAAARMETATAEREIADARAMAAEERARAEDAKVIAARLLDESETARTQLQTARNAALDELAAAREQHAADIAGSDAKSATAKSEVTNITLQLKTAQQTAIAELSKAKGNASQEVAAAEARTEAAEAEVASLREQLRAAELEIADAVSASKARTKAEVASLHEQLKAAELEIADGVSARASASTVRQGASEVVGRGLPPSVDTASALTAELHTTFDQQAPDGAEAFAASEAAQPKASVSVPIIAVGQQDIAVLSGAAGERAEVASTSAAELRIRVEATEGALRASEDASEAAVSEASQLRDQLVSARQDMPLPVLACKPVEESREEYSKADMEASSVQAGANDALLAVIAEENQGKLAKTCTLQDEVARLQAERNGVFEELTQVLVELERKEGIIAELTERLQEFGAPPGGLYRPNSQRFGIGQEPLELETRSEASVIRGPGAAAVLNPDEQIGDDGFQQKAPDSEHHDPSRDELLHELAASRVEVATLKERIDALESERAAWMATDASASSHWHPDAGTPPPRAAFREMNQGNTMGLAYDGFQESVDGEDEVRPAMFTSQGGAEGSAMTSAALASVLDRLLAARDGAALSGANAQAGMDTGGSDDADEALYREAIAMLQAELSRLGTELAENADAAERLRGEVGALHTAELTAEATARILEENNALLMKVGALKITMAERENEYARCEESLLREIADLKVQKRGLLRSTGSSAPSSSGSGRSRMTYMRKVVTPLAGFARRWGGGTDTTPAPDLRNPLEQGVPSLKHTT